MHIASVDPKQLSRFGIKGDTIVAVQLRYLLTLLHSSGESDGLDPNEQTNKLAEDVPGITDPSLTSIDVPSIEIGNVLSHAVCCCAFFHGFEEVNEHSAQALAEAAADKLNKMCEQLNLLGNRKKRGRPTSFNNPVHQVLQMHSVGVAGLYEFYHSRVLRPCRNIAQQFIGERQELMRRTRKNTTKNEIAKLK